MRLYWPREKDPSILDGSWKLPEVTKVNWLRVGGAHNASPQCLHGTSHCPIGMCVATLDREQFVFETMRR
jgi:hypothetical protein